jgi:hypothetical protein
MRATLEEPLLSCSKCGRRNFTRHGLARHHCHPASAVPINGQVNLAANVSALLAGGLDSIKAALPDCGMELCRAALTLELSEQGRPAVANAIAARIRQLHGGAR